MLLRPNTLALGQVRSSAGRFFISFNRLVLDGHEVVIRGHAFDPGTKQAGLSPSRAWRSPQGAGPSLASRVAEEGASVLLGAVTGSLVHDVGRRAAEAALRGQQPSPMHQEQALELEAGGTFELVVEEAF
jgi:hypothetical protein